jgi:CubicO group peptidase (beta-lactamase class C family)
LQEVFGYSPKEEIEMIRKKISAVILPLLALLLSTCQAVTKPVEPLGIDPLELQTFADTFFEKQMETLHIPGLAYIFVQNGNVIYDKGYGYANLDTAIPFDADSSIVRIGSISELFVATAVMQLVEQRKLDLHADINQYLTTFQIRETYPEPVMLVHLLTHTGGFEDPPYTSNTDPRQVQPLGSFLAVNMPPPTHPPGEVFIYSNYGYALVALIVENTSGTRFDLYVNENIFEPLEMT